MVVFDGNWLFSAGKTGRCSWIGTTTNLTLHKVEEDCQILARNAQPILVELVFSSVITHVRSFLFSSLSHNVKISVA